MCASPGSKTAQLLEALHKGPGEVCVCCVDCTICQQNTFPVCSCTRLAARVCHCGYLACLDLLERALTSPASHMLVEAPCLACILLFNASLAIKSVCLFACVQPSGVVVANDLDSRRAYMLVHQCKRISSPSLVVTCHEAQHFPTLNRVVTRGTEDAPTFTPGFV